MTDSVARLDLPRFLQELGRCTDREFAGADLDLWMDLGLDSLEAFALLVAVEDLAGSIIPDDRLCEVSKVRDLYEIYCDICAA